jgi:hypothetical protein
MSASASLPSPSEPQNSNNINALPITPAAQDVSPEEQRRLADLCLAAFLAAHRDVSFATIAEGHYTEF